MHRTSARPLRHPDVSSPEFMTKRAWWLLAANLLVPGAGPLLAGNRRLGRAGLRLWLFWLYAIIAAVVLWFVLRSVLFFPLTTSWGLRLLAWVFLGYGLWMAVTMIETMRQARLIRVDALARGLVLVIALIATVIPVFVGGFIATQIGVVRTTVDNIFGGGSAGLKLPADGRINVMLLGGDAGEDREGVRPDSISVMSFDAFTGQVTTIGLPRTLTDFGFVEGPMHDMYPDGYTGCNVDVCYLNSVYTEVTVWNYDMYQDAADHGSQPGIEATKDAVEWITGLDIQYYVMINMQGFADLVDAMGGVEIDVKERIAMGINDDGSPGWTPPTAYIEPGLQTLNGDHALWYARSRYETTDYARMERQRELQDAIIAQLPGAMAQHSSAIMNSLDEVVTTDIPKGQIGIIADLALKSRGRDDNIRLDLAPPLFQIDGVVPDYEYGHTLIDEALAGNDPNATAG